MGFFSGIMDVLSGIMTTFMNYCYAFTQNMGYPSYGIAIILLTLIIKLVLSPLTAKQIRSMEGMQLLQPKIKEIQKKYKGNQKKMQEEMSKLYREMGVNPLSGCLPILIQMPFLISIFYALREYPYDPAFESFLWLQSRSAGSYLRHANPVGHFDVLYSEPDVRRTGSCLGGSSETAENHESRHAAVYRLDQPQLPERLGHLLGRF